MKKLRDLFSVEIESVLSKYPPDRKRSAVMELLYLAQREDGYVSIDRIYEIADILGMPPTDVSSIVGFYTLYYDTQEGKHRIQVCTDLPCALRGADLFLEDLCKNLGIIVGETTPDGQVTVEEVMCIAGCDKAPLFQLQNASGISYHENQTVESAVEFIKRLRNKEVSDG